MMNNVAIKTRRGESKIGRVNPFSDMESYGVIV
jgi:hypothetical protein